MNIASFRNENDDFDELYQAKIYRYSSLEEVSWINFEYNIPVRIIIRKNVNELPIDLLYIPRDSHRLLIGFHGAEERKNASLPKFQFVRSFASQRKESLLFFSDSTLLLNEKVALAWMVGNQHSWFLPRVTKVINYIRRVCNYTQTVLVGHSGGGFMAVAVGSQVPNSLAIVVNAQTVAATYEKYVLDMLQANIFPEEIKAGSMVSLYSDRLDLRKILECRLATSHIAYFAHKDDSVTVGGTAQFELLAAYLGIDPIAGGYDLFGNGMILCEWDYKSSSPHALPNSVIPFIEAALGEPKTLAIDIKPMTEIKPVYLK